LQPHQREETVILTIQWWPKIW